MKQPIIFAAVLGLNPSNDMIAQLISMLPEDQHENALMFLSGYQPEIPNPDTIKSGKKEWRNIRNISHNPLSNTVSFNYDCRRHVWGEIPFKEGSEERKELAEKILKLEYDAAKNLLSSLSGSYGPEFECDSWETKSTEASLDDFRDAANGEDLSSHYRNRSKR
jgi:hypothetical protein